jgi:transposase
VILVGSPKLIAAGAANLIRLGAAKTIRWGAANLILALAFGVTLWVTLRAKALGGARGDASPAEPLLSAVDAGDVAPMTNRRIAMHRLEELVRLHRLGETTREVARLLGISPNTERAYREAFVAAGLLEGSADALPPLAELKAAVLAHRPPPKAAPPQQQSVLEAYRPAVAALFAKGLGPRAIYDRLRLEHGPLPGSYSAMKRLWRALRRERGVRPADVAIPVETAPGDVAQVDFGYVGRLFDPEARALRKAWCFVLVLGFSRHQVVRVAFDQRAETWARLHVEAFEELGGVPKTIVPDNLKAAVVRAAFGLGDEGSLHRGYRELARHYGFKVDPTPPRDPVKKGKVEAGVKYAKGNFFAGREGQDVVRVRAELGPWTREVAGRRVHGTTGEPPLERFERLERAALLPLPAAPFAPVTWKQATVHRDAHVAFDRRLYSAPWRLVGQRVWVRATADAVCVYADDERVATHARSGPGGHSTLEAHLPEGRRELRHRSEAYWRERAERLGEPVGRFVGELLDGDDALSRLRGAQAVVLRLEKVAPERARAACARASHFGSYSYAAVRAILERGLDLEPLPSAPVATSAEAPARPRFARPADTWRVARGQA